jgi:hypothetical protein
MHFGSRKSRFWIGVIAPGPHCLSGCGPALYPVHGKVTIDDKPLTTGSASLKPDKSKGNKSTASPVGKIAEDGTYTIIETDGKPGAPYGPYKVIVVAGKPVKSDDMYSPLALLVNVKYAQEDSTNLEMTVPSASADGYDLKLKR